MRPDPRGMARREAPWLGTCLAHGRGMTSMRTTGPASWLAPALLLGLLGCPSDDTEPMATTMATSAGSDGLDGPGTMGETGETTPGTTADPVGTTAADDTDGPADDTGTDTGEPPPEHVMVYQALCATCHGDEGEGVSVGMNIGPEIRHPHPDVAAYLVRNGDDNTTMNAAGALVGHPGTMPAFTTAMVTDEVLGEILAWLDQYPQPTTGDALFADYCAFCHGTTGGTDVDYVSAYHNLPFLTSGATDTLPEFIAYVRAGHVVDDMGASVPPSERREYMPPFGPDMLTDEELTLIEAWARQQ